MAEQKNTSLITKTLDGLSRGADFADWSELDSAIGKLWTISTLMFNDRDTMATVAE